MNCTSVFRLLGLLEKLGIKSAIYTHQEEVRAFAQKRLSNGNSSY